MAQSTMEARYIALAEAFEKVIRMHRLPHEIKICIIESHSRDIREHHDNSAMQWEPAEDTSPLSNHSPFTTICVDNQGAMKLADNPHFHNRT